MSVREDLAVQYSAMSDEELLLLSSDSSQLTRDAGLCYSRSLLDGR